MVRHRLDVAAAIALTAAVLWASRDVLGIRDVYPDDANRALVAKAQSFAEFRRASGTEVGQSATIATVLRATGSVTAAQVPSLVMAIAGPVLVYVAARRASLSRVAALAAGLLLACGREWSFHAGSLKANTWGGVATAALIVMATPLIEARGAIEPRRWIPLIAVAAVASVCTIFGVLASMSVAACIGVLCVRAPVKRRGALVAIGALAVGLFAWWAVVMRSTGDARNSVAYEWFRTDDLVASTHDRFVGIGTGFAPWTADYAGRSKVAGLTL